MATAAYKLTLSPLIDTIFNFSIGGVSADKDKLEDELDGVSLTPTGVHIHLDLGGTVSASWSLDVVVTDSEEEYVTVPKTIKGKITSGGGSSINQVYPLKKQSTTATVESLAVIRALDSADGQVLVGIPEGTKQLIIGFIKSV